MGDAQFESLPLHIRRSAADAGLPVRRYLAEKLQGQVQVRPMYPTALSLRQQGLQGR